MFMMNIREKEISEFYTGFFRSKIKMRNLIVKEEELGVFVLVNSLIFGCVMGIFFWLKVNLFLWNNREFKRNMLGFCCLKIRGCLDKERRMWKFFYKSKSIFLYVCFWLKGRSLKWGFIFLRLDNDACRSERF